MTNDERREAYYQRLTRWIKAELQTARTLAEFAGRSQHAVNRAIDTRGEQITSWLQRRIKRWQDFKLFATMRDNLRGFSSGITSDLNNARRVVSRLQ